MWRFRKVFSFGGFRTSLSKKGVGYSYGFMGFRFGISPSGSRYISFGIPGTGFYFIKYLDGIRQNPPLKTSAYKSIIKSNNPPRTKNSKQNGEWWKQNDLDKF